MIDVTTTWDVSEAEAAAMTGSANGLADAADILLGMADEEVPFRTGQLEFSGATDSDDKEATVYYDTPYAVRLHEDRRITPRGGRKTQWLRRAVQRAQSMVQEKLAESLSEELN